MNISPIVFYIKKIVLRCLVIILIDLILAVSVTAFVFFVTLIRIIIHLFFLNKNTSNKYGCFNTYFLFQLIFLLYDPNYFRNSNKQKCYSYMK